MSRLTDADIEAGQAPWRDANWCYAHMPVALAELAELRAAVRALFASVPREETGTEFPTEWEHWEEWDVLAALIGDDDG